MSVEAVKWALSRAPLPKSDPTARLVLVYLCEKADKHGRRAHPQRLTMAHDLDIDPETVKRVLDRLVKYGLIAKDGVWEHGQPNWSMQMDQAKDPGSYQAFAEKHRGAETAKKSRYRSTSKSKPVHDDESWTAADDGAPGEPDSDTDVHDGESGTLTLVHDDASSCPRSSIVPVHDDASETSTTMRRNVHDARSPHNHPNNHPKKIPGDRSRDADHPEARQLCERLAELMTANGCKPPTITQRWRDQARLLLDRDKRPLLEALSVLEWSQDDSFWNTNIHSMPTFREKYDKLRMQTQQAGLLNQVKTQAPKTREEVRLWLRQLWHEGKTKPITDATGLEWKTPDLPLHVANKAQVDAFLEQDRKDWITKNFDTIVAILTERSAA